MLNGNWSLSYRDIQVVLDCLEEEFCMCDADLVYLSILPFKYVAPYCDDLTYQGKELLVALLEIGSTNNGTRPVTSLGNII